jgi:RimJ/RimL family protein N-acetyltransferase
MPRRLMLSAQPTTVASAAQPTAFVRRWSDGLPVLRGETVLLRGLRDPDAVSLFPHLHTPAVREFVAPPPASVDALASFIGWTREQHRTGAGITFGIVPGGAAGVVGVIQLWPIEPDFSVAEWGFVLAERYWGTGVFEQSARLALDFAFGALGVERLEARAVRSNERAQQALRRLGATEEGILRHGFKHSSGWVDQVMWSVLSEEWRSRDMPGRMTCPEERRP